MYAIIHKSAFCGQRGALVGDLNPRPALLRSSAGGSILFTVVSTTVFLLTYTPLKGCSFQKCCKVTKLFLKPLHRYLGKNVQSDVRTLMF